MPPDVPSPSCLLHLLSCVHEIVPKEPSQRPELEITGSLTHTQAVLLHSPNICLFSIPFLVSQIFAPLTCRKTDLAKVPRESSLTRFKKMGP